MQPRARRQPHVTRRPAAAVSDLGRKHRPDYWLVILAAVLLSIGVVVVYAISPALSVANHVSGGFYVTKQLIAIALSIVAFLITSRVPLPWWRQVYKPLLVIAGLATLLALVMPVNPAYPAHRWVRLGSFSFQSVELVKFAVLVWLAGFLADRSRNGEITDLNKTLKPLIYTLLGVGAVVAGVQSDLGSFGVIVVMMGTMAFIAGLPMKRLLMIVGIIGLIGVLAISTTPYRRARLATFFHPESNCQTSGYQSCQAIIAVGSGGIIGLGLGSSVQAYGYLPEAANDSIFAIYAEKFGFIGCIALLALFIGFFNRIKSVAERSDDDFARFVVVGVLAWLAFQSIINIGAMIGLLPLKGITLPLISYGGTSVVFITAALGLVFQSSQYASLTVPRLGPDNGGRGSAAGRPSPRAVYRGGMR